MPDKHIDPKLFGDERPGYAERSDISLDPLLPYDPVLQRLSASDETLARMLKAIYTIDRIDATSPIVKAAMMHELRSHAQLHFMFPYSEDGLFEKAAESHDDLRTALDIFGGMRSAWQAAPDNGEAAELYLGSADAVEALQDQYDLYIPAEY